MMGRTFEQSRAHELAGIEQDLAELADAECSTILRGLVQALELRIQAAEPLLSSVERQKLYAAVNEADQARTLTLRDIEVAPVPQLKYVRQEAPSVLVGPITVTLEGYMLDQLNHMRLLGHLWGSRDPGMDWEEADRLLQRYTDAQQEVAFMIEAVVLRQAGEASALTDYESSGQPGPQAER